MTSKLPPTKITDYPWVYEYCNSDDDESPHNVGKWMLFYPKSELDDAWKKCKKLFRSKKLKGVTDMKCSTSYHNPRASSLEDGVIILYCNNSQDEDNIIHIGNNIIKQLGYSEKKYVYYKTNYQTFEGTIATGCKKNHTYSIKNPLYE